MMNDTAKVLAIDDEPDVLAATVRMVEKAGYQALEARSGKEGLEIALREKPELILLDVMLGDEDGVELCRRIKADPNLQNTYVALVSGKKLTAEELVAGLDAGAAEYFRRPISYEEFRPRLRTLLRLQRTEAALRAGEERLLAILDSTPFPVAVVDPDDTNIIYWSESARTLFGHTAPTTQEWYRIAYPDPVYRRDVIARWKHALETARVPSRPVNTGQYEITCADGSTRTCELYASFVQDNLIVTFNDITLRQKALESLRLKNLVFDSTISANSIADTNGIITEANPAFVRLWGYDDVEEVVGKPISLFLDRAEDAEAIIRALGNGDAWTGRYVARKKDGSTFIASSVATTLRNQKAELIGYQSSVVDVTAAIESGEALRDSEEQFRILFENSPYPTYIADTTGMLIRQNQALCDLLDVTDNELVGKYNVLEDNIVAELGFLPQVRDAFENGRPARFEIDYDSARLKSVPLARTAHKVLSTTFTPILDDSGKVRFVYVQHVDITGLKLADEALRESEERYRTLTENIGIGVSMISPEMKILALNRQMREWFPGIDVSQTPVCHRAFNDPPDEAPCSYCPTIKTLQDGTAHTATTETPTLDGIRHFRVVSTPVFDAGGGVQAAIEMVEDVTDQIVAEKERASLEEQFRQAQKMESVGRLAGGVAHDFNNLLTVILNYTGMIKEGLQPNDPLHADLDEVDTAGKRAAELTAQLLAFSRKQIISPRVLDLNSIMRGAEKMLRRVIGEDVELLFVLDDQLGKLEADPGQMNQILVNLAVNARDAMPDGGKLTVETANVVLDADYVKTHPYAKAGPHVMLAMSDSGTGMDGDTLDKIFEPFYTTKDVDKGTGLGLSTVYGIVKQSNGSIEVYSEVGNGTTFRIYLPVTERVDEDALSGASAEAPGGGETILLIEDEAAVRLVARRLLKARGYKVLEAALPEDALDIARQHGKAIDLVLTDVVMPNMSGKECCRQLREIVSGIKVLFMSGYTASVIAHRGVLDEGTPFIQKPFRGNALARKVREVLDSPIKADDPPA